MPQIDTPHLEEFLRENLVSKGKRPVAEDLCFLVGAGALVAPPTSLPTANQFLGGFLEVLLERIPPWLVSSLESNWRPTRESADLPQTNRDFKSYFSRRTWEPQDLKQSVWSRLRFETVLKTLRLAGFDPHLRLLQIYQQERSPNTMHYMLASFLESGSHILTTNFDAMIEKAAEGRCSYSYFQNPHATAAQLAESKEHGLKSILAKLHGTLGSQGARQRDPRLFRSILAKLRRTLSPVTTERIPQDVIADLSTVKLVLPPSVITEDALSKKSRH
jgi:hypothetical protein